MSVFGEVIEAQTGAFVSHWWSGTVGISKRDGTIRIGFFHLGDLRNRFPAGTQATLDGEAVTIVKAASERSGAMTAWMLTIQLEEVE